MEKLKIKILILFMKLKFHLIKNEYKIFYEYLKNVIFANNNIHI